MTEFDILFPRPNVGRNADDMGMPGTRVSSQTTEKEMKNTTATWMVQLNCICPSCEEHIDLLDYPDFWDERLIEIAQPAIYVKAVCPKCNHEFLVDCEC